MVTLNAKLMGIDDDKLIGRVVEIWGFFWDQVLTYLEGVSESLIHDILTQYNCPWRCYCLYKLTLFCLLCTVHRSHIIEQHLQTARITSCPPFKHHWITISQCLCIILTYEQSPYALFVIGLYFPSSNAYTRVYRPPTGRTTFKRLLPINNLDCSRCEFFGPLTSDLINKQAPRSVLSEPTKTIDFFSHSSYSPAYSRRSGN